MERFVKEYANYLIKSAKQYNDAEQAEKIEKILRLRNRELISTNETIIELAKVACPNRFKY